MELCNLPFPRASCIKQPGRSGHSPIEPLFPQFRNSCRLAGSNCRYGIKTWKVFRAANRSPAERSFHPFPGGGPGVFCPGRMRPVGTLDPSTTRFSLQLLFSAALSLSLEDRYICSDPPLRPLRHPKITQPGQSRTGLSLLTPALG